MNFMLQHETKTKPIRCFFFQTVMCHQYLSCFVAASMTLAGFCCTYLGVCKTKNCLAHKCVSDACFSLIPPLEHFSSAKIH